MVERLDALPDTARYACLLVAALALLILGATLLTLARLVSQAQGPSGRGALVAAVSVVLFLPIPIAMLASAWLLVLGRAWVWKLAVAYTALAGIFYALGFLSSFTNIAGFLLAAGALVLLLLPPTRAHYRHIAESSAGIK